MKSKHPYLVSLVLLFLFCSCNNNAQEKETAVLWTPQDEVSEIEKQQEHELDRMKFKAIQSKFLDKNKVFQKLASEVQNFSEERYTTLRPLILEQNIPTLQKHITEGAFTYEELTLFFLKRIYHYELDPAKTLHTIVALNPNILEEAREKDINKSNNMHPIYGMPILLKDNINTSNMRTTAGAVVLQENQPKEDAFLVQQLKKNGALILGKVNLSEWAYFFCNGCPVGYSAVGGQTLNPYGRKIFETGGSSSGSGTSIAANYAVAAIGTETSGSILSPSSQNSLVGLKPTVGLLSRSGIVPISHTLDTPGPMTRNVVDNAIVLDAMKGNDPEDASSKTSKTPYSNVAALQQGTLKGKRLGVLKGLLSDSIYNATVEKIKAAGADVLLFDAAQLPMDGFLTLLNLEMKEDLPVYLSKYASDNVIVSNLSEVMKFNSKDSIRYMPYNQGIFDGIIKDTTANEDFQKLKQTLHENGTKFFQEPMVKYNLDAILSINNYHAGYAAVGLHPCLTVPMGYKKSGEPISLTLIGTPDSEWNLLQLGYAFEKANPVRKTPNEYKY
ncbi:amidase family protein [Cochleicola gelatinilyticus]|uniref:Amidase n=1 Tax=Cochleicola gelatinilyticus TaxID=1763537 RepID=A0A167EYX2_9FLAO|nr:amidase family protein [Cochleicola gelatinilyticus]OAB76022.1 amidase [Cochleicola gelatinilyticus]